MASHAEGSPSSKPPSPLDDQPQIKLAKHVLAPAQTPCAACKMPTRFVCRTCKSAAYCSTGCQDKDGPLHNLLCNEIDDFLAANPRPSDTPKIQHKLAVSFPDSEKWPELVWIEMKIGSQTYMKGGLKHESYNVSQYFEGSPPLASIDDEHQGNKTIKVLTYGDFFPKGFFSNTPAENSAAMVLRNKLPRNECLMNLFQGCEGIAISPQSAIVLSISGKDPGKIFQKYQDITLNDLRSAIDHFCRRLELYEVACNNPCLILDSPNWIQAVKLTAIHDKAQHNRIRQVIVCHDDVAVGYHPCIPDYLGIPLIMRWERSHKKAEYGNQHSQELLCLLQSVDASDAKKWNRPQLPPHAVDRRDGSALVVRRDNRDLTKEQVEALISYIQEELTIAMQDSSFSEEARKALVDDHINPAAFSEYFREYQAKQIATGQTTWADAAPPAELGEIKERE